MRIDIWNDCYIKPVFEFWEFLEFRFNGVSYFQVLEEFKLNWTHQVPHWHFYTNAGINWLKKTEGVRYKDE